MEPKFYVYVYLDQRKHGRWTYKNVTFEYQPFYVGKGTGRRDVMHLCSYMLNQKTYKSSTIKSIIKETGELPLHRRIAENISSEEASSIEIDFIKTFGRKDKGNGILCNHTDGGDGSHNLPTSSRERIAESHCKVIYQYSLDGKFVKKWGSLLEVENSLMMNTSNIPNSILRNGTSGGFIWSYEYLGETIEARKKHQTPRKYRNIKQISLESGKVIQIYPDVASILNTFNLPYQSRNYILNCLRGKLKSALGYYWTINDIFDIPRKESARPVCQYSRDGTLIGEYTSLSVAEKKTGIPFRKIWDCCNGKSKSGEYMWRYKDE